MQLIDIIVNDMGNVWDWTYVWGLLAVWVVLALFVWVAYLTNNRQRWKWFLALAIFLVGFFLYCIGYNEAGTYRNPLAIGIRSVMSAIKMFLGDSDLLEVGHKCHESQLYMTLFSVTHISAILFTIFVAISYFGYRIVMMAGYHWNYRIRAKRIDTLNVFYGYNERSYMLAKDFYNHPRAEDGRVYPVFLLPHLSESESHISVSGLIEQFSSARRKEIIENVSKIGGLVISADFDMRRNFDLAHVMSRKLRKLDHLMMWAARDSQVNFFIVSPQGSDHLVMAGIVGEMYKYGRFDVSRVRVYCETSTMDIHRLVGASYMYRTLSPYGQPYKDSLITMVDNAQLAVRLMRSAADGVVPGTAGNIPRYTYHPVNYVPLGEGLAQEEFGCLVYGFGRTGQEAFKFLYEHGQLPMERDGCLVSALHCLVADPQLAEHKAEFMVRHPAFAFPESEQGCLGRVDFVEGGADSEAFWNALIAIRSTLRQVVIALDDDNENMRLATIIYEMMERFHLEDSRFTIFVRMHDSIVAQQLQSTTAQYGGHIVTFGDPASVYRRDTIHVEAAWDNAALFDRVFTDALGTSAKASAEAAHLQAAPARPQGRRHIDIGAAREAAASQPAALNVIDPSLGRADALETLFRKGQNVCYVYYQYAMLRLAGLDGEDSRADAFRQAMLDRFSTAHFRHMLQADPSREGQLLDRLAFGAHIRWWAMAKMQGYTPMPLDQFDGIHPNDAAHKQSVSMRPWHELDSLDGQQGTQLYKAFARLVVAANMEIAYTDTSQRRRTEARRDTAGQRQAERDHIRAVARFAKAARAMAAKATKVLTSLVP